jgi:hypothetical protein
MTGAGQPSAFACGLTWLALGLALILLALGIAWYGLSLEVQSRFWHNIFGRLEGPMTFRFYLQPAMAFFAALVDGMRDVKFGHKSFFWTKVNDPAHQHGRLREGLIPTARIVLLGLSMDIIYQFKVFDRFYPAEALMMALLLAVIPYSDGASSAWPAGGCGVPLRSSSWLRCQRSPVSPGQTKFPSNCRRAAPACRSSARA